MTLGAWMKEYLYIPLGGNRVDSKVRLYFNLWLVFLISGLWHGASWDFVIWGAFHGLFLILDRLFLIKLLSKTGKFFSTFFTFFVVLIGWVFFRMNSFHDARIVIRKLFNFHFSMSDFKRIANSTGDEAMGVMPNLRKATRSSCSRSTSRMAELS